MLFEFLEKLRKKPKETRDMITFGISIGITVVIAVVWVATYIPSVGESIKGTSMKDIAGPFGEIGDNMATEPIIEDGSQFAAPGAVDFGNDTIDATSTGEVSTSTTKGEANTGLNE